MLIAHDEAALILALERAGLMLARPWLSGAWTPDATYNGLQDLFVAVRAAAARMDSDGSGA